MLTYVEAVNAALRRALDERPETILFGEDVGEPGGQVAPAGLERGLGQLLGEVGVALGAVDDRAHEVFGQGAQRPDVASHRLVGQRPQLHVLDPCQPAQLVHQRDEGENSSWRS